MPRPGWCWVMVLAALAAGCGDDSGGDGGSDSDAQPGTTGDLPTAPASGASTLDAGLGDPLEGAAGAMSTVAPMGTPTPSGGQLRDGRCIPPEPPSRESLGDAVDVLVETGSTILAVVADPSGIYFSIDHNGVYRLAPGDDTPEVIIATPDSAHHVWTSGGYLYSLIESSDTLGYLPIERLPLSDLAATPERIIDDAPDVLDVSETHIYVLDMETQEIYREQIGGGERDVLLSGTDARTLQLGGDGFLYYSSSAVDDQIWRMPEAGGDAELVVDAGIFQLGGFLLTDGGLYWYDYRGLYFTAFGSPEEKLLYRENHSGRDLSNAHMPLAITDERIYWVDSEFASGSIGWTSLDMSDCNSLLAGGYEFNAIAVAEDGVYIATYATDNELFRIPAL